MKLFQRGAGLLLLLALFLLPLLTSAQAEDTVNVVGSGVVVPLLEALITASETEVALSVDINGTQAGFVSFCQSEADITTATRPISIEEEAECATNGVAYAELLIGHNILALIAHPDLIAAQCLTTGAIDTLFAPSAAGQIVDWTQINLNTTEPLSATPLTLLLPPDTTALYAQLDALVSGVGLRTDVIIEADESTLVETVNATPGALGVVTLNAAAANNGRVLDLNVTGSAGELPDPTAGPGAGCYAPSAENVEARRYSSADRLFVYVNRASLEKAGLRDALTFAISEAAASAVATAGYTAPTAAAYTLNQTVLAGEATGRQFSLEVVEFRIPADVFGTITIGGAGSVGSYLNTAATQFTSTYPSATTTVQIDGQVAGARRMCNGELDIIAADAPLTEEQTTNCAANNITVAPVSVGVQAAIVVANADPQYRSDYLTCLTVDQLQRAFTAPTVEENTVTTWDQVDAAFPEVQMILFTAEGATFNDILLRGTEGAVPPIRDDIEFDNDPLYRAAATANVEGALALMSWDEYQSVLANGQERIQLVSVDAGDGCVTPDETTLSDGTYPLTQPGLLLVKQAALTRLEVQSFLWYLFSDQNYSLLEDAGIVGIALDDLAERRRSLQTLFTEAQVAMLEVGPEATAEATPSAEATAEPTPEATPGP